MAKVECTCQQCGGVFQHDAKRKDVKYCSQSCYGNSRKNREVRTCQYCGKLFECRPDKIAKGSGKYCGRECCALARIKRVEVNCIHCGKLFNTIPSTIADGNGKYCSKQCFIDHRPSFQHECQQCGKLFDVHYSAHINGGGKYCSSACSQLSQQDRVTHECDRCGKPFIVTPSQVKRGIGKYCSRECRWANHPKVTCKCQHCGNLFDIRPSGIKYGHGKYCSRKCSNLAMSGEGHWRWMGGRLPYYGRDWRQQRKLAHSRDGGICQICHSKPKRGERQFQVHHIVKARRFNGDYEAANDLSNLITLCPQCHPKAERGKIAVPVRLL